MANKILGEILYKNQVIQIEENKIIELDVLDFAMEDNLRIKSLAPTAILRVTAPTGSTVYIEKNGTIITASEVSGVWTFNIASLGTWTIHASKGSDTAQEEIDISYYGEFTATIDYLFAGFTLDYALKNSASSTGYITPIEGRCITPYLVLPSGCTNVTVDGQNTTMEAELFMEYDSNKAYLNVFKSESGSARTFDIQKVGTTTVTATSVEHPELEQLNMFVQHSVWLI